MTITVAAGQHARELLLTDSVLVATGQLPRELLLVDTPQLRAPQFVRELLITDYGPRVYQLARESLVSEEANLMAPQFAREVLLTDYGPQIGQIARELLLWDSSSLTFPTAFPTLSLGFSVMKRPLGGSTPVARAASGREIRVAYWTYPQWEWDLTYEMLPDTGAQQAGVTSSDIKSLVGFILANYGSWGSFPFRDPDDYAAIGQQIATGDGTTTTFTLLKTYGLGTVVGSEPIGYLDPVADFNVYVGGVLQTIGTDYTVSTTQPYRQIVTFTTAPALGAAVAVDMEYYFQVRIKDDSNEVEKFMEKLWSMKKITLVSLKGT